MKKSLASSSPACQRPASLVWPQTIQSPGRNLKSTRAVLVFATEQTGVTGVHLMCQIFMNDLLTEQGQQR